MLSDGWTRPAIFVRYGSPYGSLPRTTTLSGPPTRASCFAVRTASVRRLAMAARIVEPDADPGADEGQAPLVELRAQVVGIRGHEAPVPELGAGVARRVHLVDDAAIAVAFPVDALDDAPGARGVRDPDPGCPPPPVP